jgi:hypothetical protein
MACPSHTARRRVWHTAQPANARADDGAAVGAAGGRNAVRCRSCAVCSAGSRVEREMGTSQAVQHTLPGAPAQCTREFKFARRSRTSRVDASSALAARARCDLDDRASGRRRRPQRERFRPPHEKMEAALRRDETALSCSAQRPNRQPWPQECARDRLFCHPFFPTSSRAGRKRSLGIFSD